MDKAAIETLLSERLPSDMLVVHSGMKPIAVLPAGYTVQPIPESMLIRPLVVEQLVTADIVDSFVEYFNKYKDQDSRVFASFVLASGSMTVAITAILDYLTPGALSLPTLRKHRLTLRLIQTPAWQTWMANDGKMLDQSAFADFLDDNISDIVDPLGADIAALCRDIPDYFSVRLQPFMGGEEYDIRCRFKFKTDDGHLTLGFKTVSITRLLQKELERISNEIAAGVSPNVVMQGQPH